MRPGRTMLLMEAIWLRLDGHSPMSDETFTLILDEAQRREIRRRSCRPIRSIEVPKTWYEQNKRWRKQRKMIGSILEHTDSNSWSYTGRWSSIYYNSHHLKWKRTGEKGTRTPLGKGCSRSRILSLVRVRQKPQDMETVHQVIEHRLFLTMSRFHHVDKLGLGYSYAEYRLSTYQILYNKARQIPRYLQDTIELIRRSASHPALYSHTKPPHNRLSSPNSPPCPLSIIRMHQPKIKLYKA